MGGTLGEAEAAVRIAEGKVSKTLDVVFVRAVLCNWLVCMAVYMAGMARDVTGKAVAIWLPISAFVAMGLEHTVANMFLIALGMLNGADVSITSFFVRNLLPVTVGNMVGALAGLAIPLALSYGSISKVPVKCKACFMTRGSNLV